MTRQQSNGGGSTMMQNSCRPDITQVEFDELYRAKLPESPSLVDSMRSCAKPSCSRRRVKKSFFGFFPLFKHLQGYNLRKDLLLDIVAGFTVGIIQIPQSMGFSLLANLPPVYGLYVSIFPVLIYSFLGSSRYLSNGTFAVISLMVANVVNRLATDPSGASTLPGHMSSDNVTDSIINGTDPVVITGIQVATCMALFIGILQIPLGFLRFGFITAYLSESLIRAFTTGAAMHVVTSQIKHLFGVSVSSYTGVLRLPYTWIDFFSKLMTTNWVALVLGVATIVFLVVMRECVNDKYKSKMFMPIPAELVVVVVMTGISYGAKLEKDWNLTVVGEIRPGLPQPSVPDVSLFPDMIGDVIAVAIISWVFNVGMAEILARKRDQEIDADQEMIALGAAHVFSSFFSCFPGTNALARSLIQESVGGVTQIAGLVSCVIVIIVSLWLGPLLYDLPNSVLAGIILVCLKGMYLQYSDMYTLWHISKLDWLVWMVTWAGVVFTDVDLGLGIGICFSLLTVVIRTQMSPSVSLAEVRDTGVYRDELVYKNLTEPCKARVFQFIGPLLYTNTLRFKTQLMTLTGVVPKVIKKQMKKESALATTKKRVQETQMEKISPLSDSESGRIEATHLFSGYHIVIDCSAICDVDLAGAKTLMAVAQEYSKVQVTMLLASVQDNVLNQLEKARVFQVIPHTSVYPTVSHALAAITSATSPDLTAL